MRIARARFRRARALVAVVLLGCIGLGNGLAWADNVTVNQIRIHNAPEYTRLVLDLSDAARFVVFRLPNPERVVVDVEDAALADSIKLGQLPVAGSTVALIRGGVRDEDDLRLVLDLSQVVRPNSFSLPPVAPYGHRLVIDLHRQDLAKGSTSTASPKVAKPNPPRPKRGRDVVVAIDAGHGGEDPGALGVGGTLEKKVVLDIARQMAKAVNAAPGFKAVLIRDGDYYVALQKRTEKARAAGADYFVSIHADAFNSPLARGASVYAVSQSGASNEAARWLAEKENRSDLIGGVRLDDKDDVLAELLLDLSMRNSLSESLDAGSSMLSAVGGVTHLHSKKVEQAGFVVLKSPDIPSLLVETGYLSNPLEERKLKDPAFRKKMGHAIFNGLAQFVRQQPPAGTWLAEQAVKERRSIRYVVEPGDTLSEIAERFRISSRSLRESNKLRNDRIRVGQVLMVPTT